MTMDFFKNIYVEENNAKVEKEFTTYAAAYTHFMNTLDAPELLYASIFKVVEGKSSKVMEWTPN